MQSFLDKLIQHLKSAQSNDFSRITVVFPTRRAGVIFRKKFALSYDKPVFSPAVYSIKDFISGFSPVRIAERMELMLVLYQVYLQYYPGTSYEKFAHWGEMLLKDFDQLDKAMADAGMLFTTVKEVKEIENIFQPGTEEAMLLSEFWKNFSDQNHSDLKKNFLQHWNILPGLYKNYRLKLISSKIAYEGLAYRWLCEEKLIPALPAEKIFFSGFYALSKAEKQIMDHFIGLKKAEMIWDADAYYTDDKFQEAGYFFRQLNKDEDNFKWKGNYFNEIKKEIHCCGIPLQEGQAKYLGSKLEELMQQEKLKPDETVVVLPDEKLLFPVLYALPPSLSSVNVTMGYPFSISQAGQLIQQLTRLYENDSVESGNSFRMDDVHALLSHPALSNSISGPALKGMMHLNYASADFLSEKFRGTGGFSWFRKMKTFDEVIDFVLDTLIHIQKNPETGIASPFQKQISDFGIINLRDIKSHANAYSKDLGAASAWHIIKDYLLSAKIPFSGEPVTGLQVMGFLETRVLDFKNVFILSCNEGTLPRSGRESSYIPYFIRRSFGLPVYDQQEAIAAYHFYRLLQRAENIYLVYNTEVNSFSGGEKSRFLLQLEQEAASKTDLQTAVHTSTISTTIQDNIILPITVTKTGAVLQQLQQFYLNQDGKNKTFSPSSLSNYMDCSLRFYLRHVAGIKETQEKLVEMDDATFGNAFHFAMQSIYKQFSDINPGDYASIESNIAQYVDEGIKEMHGATGNLQGRNILLREIMIDLVNQVLAHDKKRAPIHFKALEESISMELELSSKKQVAFNGVIDRLESTGDHSLMVVDYKTGKAEVENKFTMDDLFAGKLKAAFQLLLYGWMLSKKYGTSSITACIYPLTRISSGAEFLFEGKPFLPEQLAEFEARLKSLIEEIFDPSKNFFQTDDLKKCMYCAFRTICNR